MMKKIKEKINARLKISFDRWLKRRMPAASVQKLSSKNIFIFPTKFGFIYLLFILLLFLFGTNYQNNVIILLSYVMASLFITCMLHSFFNLSGLTFVLDGEHIGFAEQKMLVPIAVITSKERFDLSLEFSEALLSSKSQLTKSQPLRVHVDKAVKGELKFNIPFVPAVPRRNSKYYSTVRAPQRDPSPPINRTASIELHIPSGRGLYFGD